MSSAAISKHVILCPPYVMFLNSAFHSATESSQTSHIFERYTWKDQTHTPSIAFRHLPPRKDVVNQCLEFGLNPVHSTADTTRNDLSTLLYHRALNEPTQLESTAHTEGPKPVHSTTSHEMTKLRRAPYHTQKDLTQSAAIHSAKGPKPVYISGYTSCTPQGMT